MTETEKAEQLVALVEQAILNIKFVAEEERKITHKKHIDPFYKLTLDGLEVKKISAGSHLRRLKIIGR